VSGNEKEPMTASEHEAMRAEAGDALTELAAELGEPIVEVEADDGEG